eukprot:CAMPEP_0204187394 /NCGR_PEP_ID=MMETSP0361-20130328/56770_1 /ASSEMBLY_ACC=CAM_ASM_000343 /TAXON_ID=268821 /ORGANISM="Scrippsiella Hangoei, Strain SHTV-5" /LENGTH=64 /DNA_ID=CAMNT_0051147791 /DNA_START=1 /DNA_END=191 /DNA_ORIENTATION=+
MLLADHVRLRGVGPAQVAVPLALFFGEPRLIVVEGRPAPNLASECSLRRPSVPPRADPQGLQLL